jgi:hypothetical protein
MVYSDPAVLRGLRLGSPQTMGAFRIVPVLREGAPGDLRIAKTTYDAYGVVRLDGEVGSAGLHYMSYIPHGLVVSHTEDGSQASFGTSLGPTKRRPVALHHRMVKGLDPAADGEKRFRMLPLHLAMEGFLALHFRGPEILWKEYSDEAARRGLDPRTERSTRGAWISGLEEALRVFEIHEHQVGVLVFVAEVLATVFVVSHPDDYRKLHLSLLEDFFGELVATYALLYPESLDLEGGLDPARITDLDHLAREVARVRSELTGSTELLAAGLFSRNVREERIRDAGRFELRRFYPDFDPNEECHIGERIVRDDGTVEYMKTFRLSGAQVRRAYLLSKLAAADWNLDRAAEALGTTKLELAKRLSNAGFGYLVRPHVLRGA